MFITILEFIGALAALIVIHELGHFIVARLLKVEVEEFGLGFPPRLLTLFNWKGTDFTLNAIPLGGFVRPKGENDPEIAGGLAAASPFVRIAVYLAGPLANLLVAVLLYTTIFMRIGMPDPAQQNVVLINFVAPGSPAEMAGLLSGDVILQVGDTPIDSTGSLHDAIYAVLDQPVKIVYQRSGVTAETTLTPRSNPPEGQGAIGIVMGTPTKPLSVAVALPEGFRATYNHSATLLSMLWDLATGRANSEEGRLVGYKGMYDMYSSVRESDQSVGLPSGVGALSFFTSITISLGLLNLLPVPALDGGRIVFTLPEIIIRRRIPPKYENIINAVSFVLLLLLLLYVNLQDFINPLQIPR